MSKRSIATISNTSRNHFQSGGSMFSELDPDNLMVIPRSNNIGLETSIPIWKPF